MNGTELFKADGTATAVFFCESCRVVHRDKEHADSCCSPRLCECGATLDKYQAKCQSCWDRECRNREAERFSKAAHLTKWDGPVYREGYGGQDGYFESLDAFIVFADGQDAMSSTPAYVWTCDKVPVVDLDINHILENATEDAYEDFSYSDLQGIDALKAAMDTFNTLNQAVVKWVPNYTRALVFDKPNKALSDSPNQKGTK